jgi:hypothetical protein
MVVPPRFLSPRPAALALAAATALAGGAAAQPASVHPAPSAGPPAAAEPGDVGKVCQLVGERDHETGGPTLNRTESRYRFWGTDMGASFDHGGRLFVLFGDTHTSGGLLRRPDRDAIAESRDADPEDCLGLSFRTEPDGGFAPLDIPTVEGSGYSVPTGGFGLDGRMYVFATTDRTPETPMARSVLARSDDDGVTFRAVRDFSRARFINVAPVAVPTAVPGAVQGAASGDVPPGAPGPGVLVWGTGRYRASDPHLAFMPAAGVEDAGAIRYFAGLDAAGAPRWSAREEEAEPLFRQGCLGEISVSWNAPLARWIMLYNCPAPRNAIHLRTAERPWGPWSEPEILFDPARDAGFCRFMNDPDRPCAPVTDAHTRRVHGDAYGAYVVDRFTRGGPGRSSTIYFTMSTWNPYTVVLMRATLRLRDDRVAPSQVASTAR